MIVNEKYIRDIEDEDDDIAVDDGIISNGNKSYDFEVMVEYDREVRLWGYGDIPGELPDTTIALEYKERIEDVLDTIPIIKDYHVRVWYEYTEFDTDGETPIFKFKDQYMEIPYSRVKFDVYKKPTFKQLYDIISSIFICMNDFKNKYDYDKNSISKNIYDAFNKIKVNGILFQGAINLGYGLRQHYDEIVGNEPQQQNELPKENDFYYIGYNANHISERSEKGINDFQFGDVLYATNNDELVSQGINSDGTKNTPIAICFRAHEGDHRFVSLNYMSRHTPEKGQKKFSHDAIIPYGSKGVKVECHNAPLIFTYQARINDERQLVSGEGDTQKGLAYMSLCYRSKSKRACSQDVYFSDDVPFENQKGLLQAFLCVNRFHTKGTRKGDWYFPSAYEVSMFTNLLIQKDWLKDDKFDSLTWKERKESGTGKPTGIFNLHAKELINHIRTTLRYEPMLGTVICSTEHDKNNTQGENLEYGGQSKTEKNSSESVVFACLRITDVDDAF